MTHAKVAGMAVDPDAPTALGAMASLSGADRMWDFEIGIAQMIIGGVPI